MDQSGIHKYFFVDIEAVLWPGEERSVFYMSKMEKKEIGKCLKV